MYPPVRSSLFFLDLSWNCLTGTVPAIMLETLTSLLFLFLNDNLLTGSLPKKYDHWKELFDLQILDLSNNKLEDIVFDTTPSMRMIGTTMYDESSFLPSLRDFNVANNGLRGPFPNHLFQLPNLNAIVLEYNNFDGSIPSEYHPILSSKANNDKENHNTTSSTVTKQTTHSGHNNQLNNENPWSNLTSIGVLLLGHNNFIGTIPKSLLLGTKETLRMYVFKLTDMAKRGWGVVVV